MAPPLHQPLPGQQATLYQQVVQPPSKSTGRGVTFDSSADKAAPPVVKALRAAGDRVLEVGKTVADLLVTPGECKRSPPSRRQVGRHLIRRVISPLGYLPTFPQLQHLKVPHLIRAVRQDFHPVILCRWPPNIRVRVGKRTLSMPSRSTTGITSPPLRRQNG